MARGLGGSWSWLLVVRSTNIKPFENGHSIMGFGELGQFSQNKNVLRYWSTVLVLETRNSVADGTKLLLKPRFKSRWKRISRYARVGLSYNQLK